jgi:hypothetical protein
MTAPLEPTLPMTERELASLLAEAHLEGQRAALAAPPNQEWLDKAVELVHALGDADTRDDAYEALLSHLKTAQAAPIVEPAEAFDLEAKALATPVQAPGWRYGSEVMKIMEAAWTGDTKKAAAYVGLMADKMDADGHAGAKWLRQHLEVLEGKREPVYVHPATPVQAAPIEPEPVATMFRGGTDTFGRANLLQCWHSAADQLPDGEHKLYATPPLQPAAQTPNSGNADLAGASKVSPSVFDEVLHEVGRATVKFPTWPTDPLHALAVLGEEFGELTKDVLQLTYEPSKTNLDNVRKEAIQTAAMALRFLASLDRYEYRQAEQHSQQSQGGTSEQAE